MISAVLVTLLAQCAVKAEWLPVYEVLRLEDGTGFGSVQRSSCVGQRGPMVHGVFEPDGGASLRVNQSGVELDLRGQRVNVTLRSPLTFGHGFTSGNATPLDVLAVEGSTALVVPRARQDIEFLGEWRSRRVACDDLKLGSADRDGAWGSVAPTRVPLSSARGLKPSFMLAAGTHLRLDEESRSGSRVTVRLEDGATIAGWVPLVVDERERISGSIGPIGICCGPRRPEARTCSQRLPLFVRHDARLERIGTLDAETPFDVESSDGAHLKISPREQFFALFRGWELVVAQLDLEKCSEVPVESGALPFVPQHLAR